MDIVCIVRYLLQGLWKYDMRWFMLIRHSLQMIYEKSTNSLLAASNQNILSIYIRALGAHAHCACVLNDNIHLSHTHIPNFTEPNLMIMFPFFWWLFYSTQMCLCVRVVCLDAMCKCVCVCVFFCVWCISIFIRPRYYSILGFCVILWI